MDSITVVVDSREQLAFSFPAHVTVVRRALPAGDYSLEGYEDRVAVERKSLEDFVSSAIRRRERFGRELQALSVYELGCVVVEGGLDDVLAHRYRSGAHPHAVFGAALAIIVDHGVPVYFCANRQVACQFALGLLVRFQESRTREATP
jgi:ERCC4-type nuclease